MSLILECRDLHIAYDQEPTISGVNFTLSAGKCLALVGASGSGKSTIAQAVLGLHRPQTRLSGMLEFAGRNLLMTSERDWRALRGDLIGYVAQDPYSACDPLRTVGHHVAQPWRSHNRKLPRDDVWSRLANVGIDAPQHRAIQAPHCWSGGMLQRACIAAATAHTPPLIVADEPTSALDTARADDILKTLKESGSAILLISHDIDLVRRHADKIAILHKGRVVDNFAVSEIDDLTRHKATRMLVRAGSTTAQRRPHIQDNLMLGAKAIARKYAKSECTVGAVSFDVHAGNCVGLSGPSGSGKSTVLRMLAGIETPDEGHINYSFALDRPGAIMPVFQNPAASLNPYWPIWRTVSEPATVRCRLSISKRRAIARLHLRGVGMHDVDIDARPSAFSLGQCQRIAIARAVAAEPMLLIADEPTSALDTISRAQVADLLDKLVSNGMALVLASHDPWMHERLTTQHVKIA